MKTKFKIGDKVKIKKTYDSDLKTELYKNKIGKIVRIVETNQEIPFGSGYYYLLDIDNKQYKWADEMLKKIKGKKDKHHKYKYKSKYSIGEKILFNKNCAEIIAVKFYKDKIFYDLKTYIRGDITIIEKIDAALIVE